MRTACACAEAFMVRHHPQWIAARERMRAGGIGALREVNVEFAYRNLDPADIRNQAGIGGGALYDIGCYAIVAGRWFFEAEPERAAAFIARDPAFGIDAATSGLMDFGRGRHLVFSVSTQVGTPYQRVRLVGSTRAAPRSRSRSTPRPSAPAASTATPSMRPMAAASRPWCCRRPTSTACRARPSRTPCAGSSARCRRPRRRGVQPARDRRAVRRRARR